ncbi:MAG: 3'-5' exonuclease [Candidatus Thiodiazotropha sp. (ex Dulcina madagascariensis)]|nr:3'-5' exonuclease [Candidatus Thiodiazotropha sp. (ex Epidulcina cf. delphinae)]MCU7924005.1 3'-5' exonuclease [Candidatus Thiodiazotropha sp. (ex Dulcina madagascariensis)]MCU7925361.1 3'-5' exonuclease [Candidatus Thiodiazotropha sp. (ex Dulcina madagascariensis)]MCU7933765.1 3'-5' exonuclease [Candidatus Thiodiazotropha sp. (ex Dulcina madagascariensis)]
MLNRFLSLDSLRKKALSKAAPGILHDYLETPLTSKTTQCDDLVIVSLDLETTGLDPEKDKILSFGLVEMRHMTIRLETARHQLISIDGEIPEESAVIHQITDDQAATGIPIEAAMPELLQRLAGKVMLVHYAAIEQNFISTACQKLFGAPFVIPTIDTLVLAQRLFEHRNHTVQPGDLRLFNLRPRYNLPNYKAHNALSDALATAELFLAMASDMVPRPSQCRLNRFLTR